MLLKTNKIQKYITFCSLIVLTSCASITTGGNQSLSVHTDPEKGANCELSNNKGTYYIHNTPGTVTVKKAYGDMTVLCRKGDKSNVVKVKSSTIIMNAGNIIFGLGAFVGLAVDVGTGSGYEYPTLIHVPLN